MARIRIGIEISYFAVISCNTIHVQHFASRMELESDDEVPSDEPESNTQTFIDKYVHGFFLDKITDLQ